MIKTALLVNSGSSSLKVSCWELDQANNAQEELLAATVDQALAFPILRISHGPETLEKAVAWQDNSSALIGILDEVKEFHPSFFDTCQFIAHRVVHGGHNSDPIVLNEGAIAELEQLNQLAPLHNPPSLEIIRIATNLLPTIPQYATFDTSFHTTIPPHAANYGLPTDIAARLRIKRYGFHGLSYSYATARAIELLTSLNRPSKRLVICHLGHGCSAAAVMDGQSLDTTMGFTPLEGLVMATRSGSLDPAIVTYLQEQLHLSPQQVLELLNKRSGLLGLSRHSSDMRTVISAANQGDISSRSAIELFCYRVQCAVAALTVPLGGIDSLVFTGGIGENSGLLREKICSGLAHFGISLQGSSNAANLPDTLISPDLPTCPSVLLIKAREDLAMIRAIKSQIHPLAIS